MNVENIMSMTAMLCPLEAEHGGSKSSERVGMSIEPCADRADVSEHKRRFVLLVGDTPAALTILRVPMPPTQVHRQGGSGTHQVPAAKQRRQTATKQLSEPFKENAGNTLVRKCVNRI
jgi:hypothetical protein